MPDRVYQTARFRRLPRKPRRRESNRHAHLNGEHQRNCEGGDGVSVRRPVKDQVSQIAPRTEPLEAAIRHVR